MKLTWSECIMVLEQVRTVASQKEGFWFESDVCLGPFFYQVYAAFLYMCFGFLTQSKLGMFPVNNLV